MRIVTGLLILAVWTGGIVCGYLALVAVITACGIDNGPLNNPASKDYPCGPRGIVCATSPILQCCWGGDTCGQPVVPNKPTCPEGFCCNIRGMDDGTYGVESSTDAGTMHVYKQWSPK